jgi:PAS domain S-box-containing protein
VKNQKTTSKLSGASLVQEPELTTAPDQEQPTGKVARIMQSHHAPLVEQISDPRLPVPGPGLLRRLYNWFITSTFTPSWLPERFQHPIFGYLAALLLQMIAVLFTLYLDAVLQVFIFIGTLEILAIALVALSWGVGPSVIATLVGACFFDFIILPPQFSWAIKDPRDFYQLLLFVLIGLAISIVSSQTERARRRAEHLADSLTKEHARLEAIIETVPDIVAIYDKRGCMTQMNEVGQHSKIFDPEMRNPSLEELFRAHRAFTLEGVPVEQEELPIARALHGETVESTEVRFFDSAGNERFISISAAPLRNIRGKIDGVVSVTRDLSALHQSEREAANRAIELEAIFQSLADGLFMVNTDGEIIRSNAVFQEIVGFKAEDKDTFMALSREQRYALLHASDENGMQLPFEAWPETRILKGEVLKGASVVDLHLRNLAGRDLQLSIGGAPLFNKDGKLVAALCICRDVTERRILEQRTHDALDALLTMAEALVSSDEGMLEEYDRTNASKKIALRMARLTSKLLGCSRACIFLVDPATSSLLPMAIVGLPSDEEKLWWTSAESLHLHPCDHPLPWLIARLQAGEVVLLNKRNEPVTLLEQNLYSARTTLVAPMKVGEQLIGVLALGMEEPDSAYTPEDIALAGAVAHLLALVFERDRLLRERAEAQATELALRTAQQRMEEFLGMVSHELKTPLTSIKGNTQLAIRQLRSSMQSFERIFGLYEAAEQQSRRLNRLVDDLLDVSRAQAGHLELIPGPCDLRAIVHEALQEQQKIWPGRRIDLEMDEATALPLEADADRIAQAISNYLTNALKYSDPDRPVLVSAQREARQVYLAVRDQGPGLPPEEQEQIWSRFHRAPGIEVRSSSHSSQAGLGLGLSITKNIIEGQQGEVGVQSAPGEGSTFWFRLPLRSEEDAETGY